MENQRTIRKEIQIKGKGIHTANPVTIRFIPAGADTGILFKRTDLTDAPVIKAAAGHILDNNKSPRHTSLGYKGVEIQTVEHLMASLSALSIDNLLIEVDNIEIPAMDGSALSFIKILKEAGIEELDSRRKVVVLKEPVCVDSEDAFICAMPSSKFKISYTLDHNHSPYLKTQYLDIDINEDIFERDIAPSRTFVREGEAEALIKQGYGKGADYENTLVISDKGVIKNKLRFEDEFLRHKILDLIGDLYLLGKPIYTHIIAIKSGHFLNHQLIKKIQAQIDKRFIAALNINLPVEFEEGQMDIQMIKRILPHRYPFLLVDRIIELEKGKRAVGIKNVTANEMFFNGHFPSRPVMPGVLIVEAMAQVGGILMLSPEEHRGKLAFFMSMNNVKFRKTVVPGDQLVIEARAGKMRSKAGQLLAQASVDGELVAEAELMFALIDE